MQDLHGTIEYVQAIVPALNTDIGTDTITSKIIDLASSRGCEFILNIGTLTDMNATYSVTLMHGNTLSGGSQVGRCITGGTITDSASVSAALGLVGTAAAAAFTYANDLVMRTIGYAGVKRYVYIIVGCTGANSGDTPLSASCAVWKSKAS